MGAGHHLDRGRQREVPRELPAQEGKVAFDQFMADGSYVVERSEGDPRNYVGYRDDKLGIGEDGESVVVADPAWPRPSVSGKLEIYCQYKADNVNRIGLNDTPIKPYANYLRAAALPGDVCQLGGQGEGRLPAARPTRRTTCAAPTPATTT